MKKLLALVAALAMVFSLSACGETAAPTPKETSEPTPISTPAGPETPAETSSTNPLMNCEVKEGDVLNGNRDTVLGTRAYIELSKAEFDSVTDEQLAEFVLTKVVDSGYNWFSILFGDGTGVCFASSLNYGSLGDLDDDGAILKATEYITVDFDGTVSREPAEQSLDTGAPEQTTGTTELMESAVALVEMSLEGNYENYTVDYDDGLIIINVWQDGIAAGAVMASTSDSLKESWDTMSESIRTMGESCKELLDTLGLEDCHVMINVLNDQNTDNVLLTIMDSAIVYDIVNDLATSSD